MNPVISRRDLLVAALAAAAARSTPAQETVYKFSPVNQYGINLTAGYWNPIISYISQKSGVKLQLKIGRTSADTTAFVLAREVDFVFSNHLFSPEREQLGWKVIGRRDTPPVRGQLVVPEESPLTELAQLAGKEVAFPGPEATVSYKFTYGQLLQRKIDVKVVFGGNTDGALAQMFSGKVAAAGCNSQLVEGYARREGRRYRVLWESAELHDLALMSSSQVPEPVVRAVAAAFAGMRSDPAGLEILQQASRLVGLASADGFVASNGGEYAGYREFYRSAPPQVR